MKKATSLIIASISTSMLVTPDSRGADLNPKDPVIVCATNLLPQGGGILMITKNVEVATINREEKTITFEWSSFNKYKKRWIKGTEKSRIIRDKTDNEKISLIHGNSGDQFLVKLDPARRKTAASDVGRVSTQNYVACTGFLKIDKEAIGSWLKKIGIELK